MAEVQSEVRGQLADFARRLTVGQKALLGLVSVGSLAAIILLAVYVNRPALGTLFSNLAPQDAAKIVEKLKEKNISYTLEDNGKTILVSKDHIYDLRLSLAGEGLPQSSVIGYEIFDRTNLGVSDFVQKVNYRRAMEGELARTILQLDEVEGARVHIVVPERTLFKEDEKSATASVVLKLKANKPLKRETIQGIVHLVASSVEGLEAGNVTVVDSKGVLLSETNKPNSLTAMSATQYEVQQKVESYLTQKAQGMLEGVVGVGNAIVQVNAELDFRQVERTLEQYDPENTAIRSEQVSEEKSVLKDSLQPSTRSNTVTNYEVNKTLERIVENVGGIKRLSVAAMVNGRMVQSNRNGESVTEYVPRPPEEMNQLSDLIKRAVGYNPQRNDEISVVNLPFGQGIERGDFLYREEPSTDWDRILERVFLVLAMIGGVLIIRSLLGRLRVRTGDELAGEAALGAMVMERQGLQLAEGQSMETPALRAERRRQIAKYINERPEDASRLIKVWLVES